MNLNCVYHKTARSSRKIQDLQDGKRFRKAIWRVFIKK